MPALHVIAVTAYQTPEGKVFPTPEEAARVAGVDALRRLFDGLHHNIDPVDVVVMYKEEIGDICRGMMSPSVVTTENAPELPFDVPYPHTASSLEALGPSVDAYHNGFAAPFSGRPMQAY